MFEKGTIKRPGVGWERVECRQAGQVERGREKRFGFTVIARNIIPELNRI